MDVVVEPLSSHPDAVPTVAEWHFRAWGHADPGGSLETWTAGMARKAGAGEVPGTLIALAARTPVAVVCLVERDMPGYWPAAGLTPWIKGRYVIPSARRQGVGGLLVRRCEAWAARIGQTALYLYTERGPGALEPISWQAIHAGRYDGIAMTVMRTRCAKNY